MCMKVATYTTYVKHFFAGLIVMPLHRFHNLTNNQMISHCRGELGWAQSLSGIGLTD